MENNTMDSIYMKSQFFLEVDRIKNGQHSIEDSTEDGILYFDRKPCVYNMLMYRKE